MTDVFFLHQGQHFVWDRGKATSNVSKHGVKFEMACQVFFDPFLRVEDAGNNEEHRDAAIGLAEDWSMLYVVHMLREGDLIRIISARAASAQERRLYEEGE